MSFSLPKKSLPFIVLGLLTYLVSLVASIPASMVISHLLPTNISSYVKYNGVSGSVWQGQVASLSVRQIPLGKLQWDLSILPLLWGTTDVQLSAKREGALLLSGAKLRSDSVVLQDTRFEMGIADLMPLLYGFPVSLEGNIKVFFSNIEIDPGSKIIAEGRAVLSDINMVAPQAMSLGNLVAVFERNENGTRVNVNDQQGPVQVDAVVTLSESGFYNVNATLIPRSFSGVEIKNALAMFAKADSQGRYTINTRGRLPVK